MNDELFDITPIPTFPFVPAWWHWLLILLVPTLALLWRVWTSRRSQKASYSFTREEITRLFSGPRQLREKLEVASLLTRRYLAAVTEIGYDRLTASELLDTLSDDSSPELRTLINVLSEVMQESWSPLPSERMEQTGRQLLDALDGFNLSLNRKS